MLDEASFNSQEPRPQPGSSKRLRQNDPDEEGACQRQSKKARRSIAYDDDSQIDVDERSASEDEMSASEDISASEDEFVVKNSDDDDNDEDDDDDVEQIGGRKLMKGKISERLSFPSQVLSLFSLLCIFQYIKVFDFFCFRSWQEASQKPSSPKRKTSSSKRKNERMKQE